MSSLRFAANCSLLFPEVPIEERPAAAKAEGFDAIEFWWPWPHNPVPTDSDVTGFVTAVRDAGVQLIGLNFFAGDLTGADCGVASIPDRSAQFRDNIDVAVGIGRELQVGAFNALFGNRVDGVAPEEQDELGVANLVLAAEAAAGIGATVLLEPVSGPKPYPLRTASDVVSILDRVESAGASNVGLLADLFHLANNGDNLDEVISTYADRVAHVQIADLPGRGQPGTGGLDLHRYLDDLESAGYAGYVALEYNPTGSTTDSLDWLPRDRRGSAAVRS